MSASIDLVFLLFPHVTPLDAVGPYEVLSRLPGARVRLAAPTAGPLPAEEGALALVADTCIDDVSRADVLVVPGGWGTRAVATDARVLAWVQRIDTTTQWTCSVCTGALILGAAGLLDGRRATTHWAWRDELPRLGAIPSTERVVTDGKYMTAAGVSAGIDLGLTLAARLAGEPIARAIQLGLEYDPQPPFTSGTPETAPPMIVSQVRAALESRARTI